MENRELRLIEVEHTLTDHGSRIQAVESKITLLHRDLAGVKTVLTNIKWWIIGVGSVYIAEQIGITSFIKNIISI